MHCYWCDGPCDVSTLHLANVGELQFSMRTCSACMDVVAAAVTQALESRCPDASKTAGMAGESTADVKVPGHQDRYWLTYFYGRGGSTGFGGVCVDVHGAVTKRVVEDFVAAAKIAGKADEVVVLGWQKLASEG